MQLPPFRGSARFSADHLGKDVPHHLPPALGERDEGGRTVIIERPQGTNGAAVEPALFEGDQAVGRIAANDFDRAVLFDDDFAHLFDGLGRRRVVLEDRDDTGARLVAAARDVHEEMFGRIDADTFLVALDRNAVDAVTEALPLVADDRPTLPALAFGRVNGHGGADHDLAAARLAASFASLMFGILFTPQFGRFGSRGFPGRSFEAILQKRFDRRELGLPIHLDGREQLELEALHGGTLPVIAPVGELDGRRQVEDGNDVDDFLAGSEDDEMFAFHLAEEGEAADVFVERPEDVVALHDLARQHLCCFGVSLRAHAQMDDQVAQTSFLLHPPIGSDGFFAKLDHWSDPLCSGLSLLSPKNSRKKAQPEHNTEIVK